MNDPATAIVWGSLQATLFAFLAIAIYFAARRFGPRVGATTVFVTLLLLAGLAMMAFSPWPRWQFDFDSRSGLGPQHMPATTASAVVNLHEERNGTFTRRLLRLRNATLSWC